MENAGRGMRMQEHSLEDDTWEEEYEKVEDTKETVSENIVEDAFDVDVIPARSSFFPQVYSYGKSFSVDGKAYNSMDAVYATVDDITAYFFIADSLL